MEKEKKLKRKKKKMNSKISCKSISNKDVVIDDNVAAIKRRKFCDYDAKCTRTNPKHFKEFAHPGLTNRKVCKYLSNCTRKNEQHWMEFRQ